MCNQCYIPSHIPPYVTYTRAASENVRVMQAQDWLTLVFCCYVIALSIGNELRDLKVCELGLKMRKCKHYWLVLALRWNIFIRQFCVLPLMASTVSAIVAIQGGK